MQQQKDTGNKDGLFKPPVAIRTVFCPQVSRSENKSMNWTFTVPESVDFFRIDCHSES